MNLNYSEHFKKSQKSLEKFSKTSKLTVMHLKPFISLESELVIGLGWNFGGKLNGS